MTIMQTFIILCGLAAVLYGFITSRQILSLNSGSEKMQEIAKAIQEGAKAYLNRQYLTISIVGIVIFFLIWIIFDLFSAIGFLIGAFFSGAAGYVGMNISVRSNVRTTQAASSSLAEGLSVSFKAGAVTGMLVAGFALISVAAYYFILDNSGNFETISVKKLPFNIGYIFPCSFSFNISRLKVPNSFVKTSSLLNP